VFPGVLEEARVVHLPLAADRPFCNESMRSFKLLLKSVLRRASRYMTGSSGRPERF
jgi:hypothetical protein